MILVIEVLIFVNYFFGNVLDKSLRIRILEIRCLGLNFSCEICKLGDLDNLFNIFVLVFIFVKLEL